ncbi:MazG nucleotide pyrophosphohydrolase domain-containing protein [Arthrobacter sp. H5]|uniref:MazG nucleotide pyrophosphohydrolase domain-containing protein n=1 Tax=Arthrobacter sp. H5 TaxID=1267973 RepID=UPI0004B951BD|nr:MazG nucleotide pyrophosphohydrolase domain-containing protein [Arthrobacter sp. H5]
MTGRPAGPFLDRLVEVVGLLRRHCPWMAELTHDSLVEYLVEECYELVEAIETHAPAGELRGELGDVLLQVVLHAQLQQEQGSFAMTDVVEGLTRKMVRRNPHVFRPDGTLQDSFPASVDQIVSTWHRVKQAENPARISAFAGVPQQLPALALASKSLSRAERGSYGGTPQAGAVDQVTEEELGQELLDLVRRARCHNLDPEHALRRTVRRFQQEHDAGANNSGNVTDSD